MVVMVMMMVVMVALMRSSDCGCRWRCISHGWSCNGSGDRRCCKGRSCWRGICHSWCCNGGGRRCVGRRCVRHRRCCHCGRRWRCISHSWSCHDGGGRRCVAVVMLMVVMVMMMLMVPTLSLLEEVGDAVEVRVGANDECIRAPVVVQVEANDGHVPRHRSRDSLRFAHCARESLKSIARAPWMP